MFTIVFLLVFIWFSYIQLYTRILTCIRSNCCIACDNAEFLCNVLAVADQLLIGRLKELCEVALAQLCELF